MLLASGIIAASAHDASAQVQRSGGGANAALAQQYQQTLAEKTQLQADKDKLQKELDDTKKQLEAAKAQLAASKSTAGSAASQLAAAQAAAQAASQSSAQAQEQARARMLELVNRFRDTAVTLRGVEAERSQLQQQLVQSKASFDQCAERNYQLYQVDNEVLDHYEHEGAFSHLARAEPFTRIKRTQVENLVDEYKARAEELRVQRAARAADNAPATAPVPFAAPPPAGGGESSPAPQGADTPPATSPADAPKP
jgi:chromosome segregation ATPase